MKSFITTMILACFILGARAQQSAQFTQYMFNGLILNPAYAGMDKSLSMTFVNRSQWISIDGAPVTQTLSAHTLLTKQQLGIGLTLVNDKIGIHKNQKIMGAASYHLKVSPKGTLSFGLQGGLNIVKSNYASLASNSSTMDPQLANAGIAQTYMNLGMGFYFSSPRFHVGFSIPDLMPQRYALNDTITVTWQKAHYFLFSKYIIPLNDELQLEPSMLIKYNPGLPLSFDINACLVIKKALTLGLSYRKSESIDFLLKAQLTPQLQFGYSYDYVTGEVSNVSRGTHELMVSYLFKYTHTNVASPR
ncbi:MAG TPA: type IX secretion system membrane protein PorP/SprF [Chryseolinea sp.]|nr:type IX secretion system membrane protein PorP/SprF [Chryseolinea sp.]